ncbi:hypothetical protein HMY34_16720 [Thiothrix subterranea]|uniref:hypothetical protein n=1 Tax=Thiothrix subterranea TaxID=2735563 RepID=UPI00192B46A5|nr:hypothetical protein [Thiothrix subterranea]QQZ27263.1 hypothetical protein HMY34_16720 [Thiothrix subterranea]
MTQSYSRIFLLSHMRAYSSLLGHIIGSQPRINGYYEMHQSYLSDADLAQQIADYSQYDSIKTWILAGLMMYSWLHSSIFRDYQ